MASTINTATGGTDTTVVTTGNSGGASGDAFSAVTIAGTGGNITYSSTTAAHDGLSIAFNGSTTAANYVTINVTAGTTHSLAFGLYVTDTPGVASEIMRARNTTPATACKLALTATGFLQVQDSAGTGFNTTAAVPLNTWCRVEFSWIVATTSTGQMFFKWYNQIDSLVPVDTYSSGAVRNLLAANVNQVFLGRPAFNAWQTRFYMDDIRTVDATTTLLGPFAFNNPMTDNIQAIRRAAYW